MVKKEHAFVQFRPFPFRATLIEGNWRIADDTFSHLRSFVGLHIGVREFWGYTRCVVRVLYKAEPGREVCSRNRLEGTWPNMGPRTTLSSLSRVVIP